MVSICQDPEGMSLRAHQTTEADALLRLGHMAEPAEGMALGTSSRVVLAQAPDCIL